MPERKDPENDAINATSNLKLKFLNQLYNKGPLVGVLAVVIICLYSWVADGRQKDAERISKLEAKGDSRDQKLEAYQKYVQGELFQKLDQSNRVIERNTYVLEEISRKLDRKN
jgi:hypothetical protein